MRKEIRRWRGPPLPAGEFLRRPLRGDLPNGGDGKTGSVSFLAAGDIIIHEAVFTDAAKRASALAATDGYAEKYYFTSMFDGVKETVSRADLAFVNFECPIAGDGYGALGYPNFNAPKAAGDAVAALGFDIVNIANNHMLDMDGITTGLKNTADYWRSKDLLTVGGYTKSDYDELRVIEKNGISIAFLSYTYGTNGSRVNSGSPEYLGAEDRGRNDPAAAEKGAERGGRGGGVHALGRRDLLRHRRKEGERRAKAAGKAPP